jgi:hypothetical protein
LKQDTDNFPDLEAAFEAVKGLLFGPVDAATVKLKFNEVVKDAKDKREVETNPLSALAHARDEREFRDRKDRDQQHMTLRALLASNAAYRAAHENAMAAFAAAGNAIDEAIEAGEQAYADVSEKIEDYLASTPQLKDGRYVMFDAKDGIYKDQNFEPISEDDLAGVDKQAVKPILPYERMMEWKAEVGRDLDELRGYSVEIGDRKNQALDDKNPTQEEQLKDDKEWAEDLRERAEKFKEKYEQPAVGQELTAKEEIAVVPTSATAIPKL